MSTLRNHFEAEKQRYASFVYPGNLAAEILGANKVTKASIMDYADAGLRRRPWLLRWVVGLGAVGAAAALLLFLYVHRQPTVPLFDKASPFALNPDQGDEDVPLALTSSVSIPEGVPVTLTSAVSIAPDTSSMSFSSIPSFSDLSSSDQTAN